MRKASVTITHYWFHCVVGLSGLVDPHLRAWQSTCVFCTQAATADLSSDFQSPPASDRWFTFKCPKACCVFLIPVDVCVCMLATVGNSELPTTEGVCSPLLHPKCLDWSKGNAQSFKSEVLLPVDDTRKAQISCRQ